MIKHILAGIFALLITSSAWGQVVTPGPPTPSGNLPFTPAKIFNITDQAYGAVCDGTTDDAAHIQSAFTAAGANGGRVILPLGKTCAVASTVVVGNNNVAPECSTSGEAIATPGPCALKWIGPAAGTSATGATVSAAGGSSTHSYVPGDGITLTGGTSSVAPTLLVATTQVSSATAGANGIGCTDGTYTVTGTTGVPTKFQASITVTSNVPVVNSISVPGSYYTNPTSLTAEPVTGVTGCSTQPKLSVNMGVLLAQVSDPGIYTVLPSNPVAQGASTGVGTGATFTMTWGGAIMRVAPTVGAGAPLTGVSVKGISFICDGTQTAAYGLMWMSVRAGEAGNYYEHCSTAALYLGHVALTVNANNQNNLFSSNQFMQNGNTDGYAIKEQNANASFGSANSSENTFLNTLLFYKNSHGIYIVGADHERFISTHELMTAGGSAYGVYLTGNATFTAQANTFLGITPSGLGVYLDGTTNLPLPTKWQMFLGYDMQGSALPTADTSADYRVYREDGLLLNLYPVALVGINAATDFNAMQTWLATHVGYAGVVGFGTNSMAVANATGTCGLNIDGNNNFRISPNTNCGAINLSSLGQQIKVRKITSGSADTATFSDKTIAWNSNSGIAKAQAIQACAAGRVGADLTIIDEQGDANTNNITITPLSGTINGAATKVINTVNGFVHLTCDGGTNYLVN